MRLKVVTLALGIFALIQVLGFPWIVGQPPKKDAGRHALAVYAFRAELFVPVLSLTMFGIVVCCVLLARKAREEYLAASAENLRHLIEGTLQDHKKEGPKPE